MAFTNNNAASQLFGGINLGARQAAGGWKMLDDQQRAAGASAASFVKTMFAGAGLLAALKEITKVSSSKQNVLDKLVGSPSEVKARLSAITGAVAKLDAQADAIQARLSRKSAFGNYWVTGDQRDKLKEKLRDKQEQAAELEESIPSRMEVAKHGILSLLKNPAVDASLVVGQQVLSSWYSFNDAIKATNVSSELRRSLYNEAIDNEVRLGRTLGDTAAIMDVARKNGMLYGKTVNASLAETVKLSLQAEDALGLQPHDIDEIIASSNKMATPYHEVLDTITDINQQLGLSGEEASKLYAQTSDLAFSFGLSGRGVSDVTGELGKMTLALRSVGITDNQAALRIVSKLAESGTASSFMFNGGPQILDNKEALTKALNNEAGYLRNFAPKAGLTGAGLNQANIVFKQVADSLGLTTTEGFELIKMVDAMNSSFGKIVTKGPDVVDVAAKQLEESGKIWKRLGEQLFGVLKLGFIELTPLVQKLSEGITWLHDAYTGMSDSTKTLVKWISFASTALLGLAGVMAAVKIGGGVLTALRLLSGGAAVASAASGGGVAALAEGQGSLVAGLVKTLIPSVATALTTAGVVTVIAGIIGDIWLLKKDYDIAKDVYSANKVATDALQSIPDSKLTDAERLDRDSDVAINGKRSLPAVQLDQIGRAQRRLIDQLITPDVTVQEGHDFLTRQNASLDNSFLSGQQKAGVRDVYSDEIKKLEAQAIDRLSKSTSETEQTALLRELSVMKELLKELATIGRDDIRTYTKQWQQDTRDKESMRSRNESMGFVDRSSALLKQADAQFGWSGAPGSAV